ncbi:MAG: DUF5067 domain-containing protein [Atopobiaceae bacterium]|nr:DUF5067 domain-containing protein [Atopobiaceae bacterium]
MLEKSMRIAVTITLVLSLCACGASGGSQPTSSAQSASEVTQSKVEAAETKDEKKSDSKVDKIDLSLERGSIRFNRVERANDDLTEAENSLVFVFDYTGASDDPIAPLSTFIISFYQNGVELTDRPAYSSKGGEQYELVKAALGGVMKGGTSTFGQLITPKDNSPITVVVKGNATLEKDQQMMEVAIDSVGGGEASSNTAGAKDKDAEKPAPQPFKVGDTASNEQFNVTLTDARVDSMLSSDESSTYWEADNGSAFVILEFDVTALTSDQLPVDGKALANLVANYNGDIYKNWKFQYVEGQLWLYFHNTYLDANIPCHVYAWTNVPVEAINGGNLSVSLDVAGGPRTITIR